MIEITPKIFDMVISYDNRIRILFLIYGSEFQKDQDSDPTQKIHIRSEWIRL
jgi:hypothetical protein